MEQFDSLSEGQLVAVVDAAVTALNAERLGLADDRQQLEVLAGAIRAAGRLAAWAQTRAAELHAAEAAERAHGTSLATWAMTTLRFTHREAARLVRAGEQLDRFPIIGRATRAGEVLPAQAEAITTVLSDLPDDLPAAAVVEGEALMVGFAATHNSAELRRLSAHLLECLAPEVTEQKEADRLEREHRQAVRTRHLVFSPDHRGSVFIRGSLPTVDAASLMALLDGYLAAQQGIDRLDPLSPELTPAMRRADALMALVHAHAEKQCAPSRAGDRPRATVTLDYGALHRAARDAGLLKGSLISTGEAVPASVLRRLLCDADVLPIVLGSDAQPLDVGRAQRLVTPAIRAALEVRDHGCVFPGCDKAPAACHAHHIVPWWAGGVTALHNLVLLCPHHHGLVEPGHDPTADRWRVHLDGAIPVITPPRRVDPRRQPRVHARFRSPIRRT